MTITTIYRLAPVAASAVKPVVKCTLIAIALLGLWGARSPVWAVELTLVEALESALDRPYLLAEEQHVLAAERRATAEWRATFLPTLAGIFEVAGRDRDLYTRTPMGDFPYGQDVSRTAGVQLMQPIFDPVRLLGTAPAARWEARARGGLAARAREEMAAEAGEIFIDVLVIDARLLATEAYIQSLTTRLEEIEAMCDAGRVLATDTLKVRLALDAARQGRLSLREARAVTTYALGLATGHTQAIEPVGSAEGLEGVSTKPTELIAVAQESRTDLQALEKGCRALQLRRRAIVAEALPRVEASVRWNWTDADVLAPREWAAGALTLSWNPFASGSRLARAEAQTAEMKALAHNLEEVRRSLRLEIYAALGTLETARGALAVGELAVEQSTEALRVERERYQAGRATANDLLVAEALLRDKWTERDVARLEVQRAWLRLRKGQGVLCSQISCMHNRK